MTEIQKEYCEEKGLIYINPENTEIADYVSWLEAQIQALRIHDVVGRSEQSVCDHSKHPFFRVLNKTRKCNGCGEIYEAN